jgi:hypothetical protein
MDEMRQKCTHTTDHVIIIPHFFEWTFIQFNESSWLFVCYCHATFLDQSYYILHHEEDLLKNKMHVVVVVVVVMVLPANFGNF